MSDLLRLGKNQDRRLRAGHLWVYSNEVDAGATPLGGFEPGQAVEVESAQGKWLGTAYVNPNSLICARLVSRNPDEPLAPPQHLRHGRVVNGSDELDLPGPLVRNAVAQVDA